MSGGIFVAGCTFSDCPRSITAWKLVTSPFDPVFESSIGCDGLAGVALAVCSWTTVKTHQLAVDTQPLELPSALFSELLLVRLLALLNRRFLTK